MSTTVNMFVKARRTASGAIEWDLDPNNSPQQGVKRPIMLPIKGGKHRIIYHLIATPGLNYRFDCDKPIWTADNSDCPPASGLNSDQIKVEDCDDNKLTIENLNNGPARLVRYQLNFLDAAGAPVSPACDPAILNGGGGID